MKRRSMRPATATSSFQRRASSRRRASRGSSRCSAIASGEPSLRLPDARRPRER
jgi:hypothetical protein